MICGKKNSFAKKAVIVSDFLADGLIFKGWEKVQWRELRYQLKEQGE